jgi:hypothetical protein
MRDGSLWTSFAPICAVMLLFLGVMLFFGFTAWRDERAFKKSGRVDHATPRKRTWQEEQDETNWPEHRQHEW